MSDWTGGFAGARPASARIPVKIHRNVSLIQTSEPFLADELLARPKLARLIVGRLASNILLVWPGKAAEAIEELKKMGHAPRVVNPP